MNIIEIPLAKTIPIKCPHVSGRKCALFECHCEDIVPDAQICNRAYGCSKKLCAEILSGYEPGKIIFAKANGREAFIKIKSP